MPAVNPIDFFKAKHRWSEYKDQILDYYLKPYLPKVARLRKPIVVVDCFAGAGRFDDGKPGSPLIIAQHIADVRSRGVDARAIVIEKDASLSERLSVAVAPHREYCDVRPGDFHDFIPEFSQLARTHTLFLYLDPINPQDLHFDDLADVYEALGSGSSVEALVNFLSTPFFRRAAGLVGRRRQRMKESEDEGKENDRIFGGGEWAAIIGTDDDVEAVEPIERLAQVYADRMRRWFKWNLRYPIREQYGDKQPKYHLVFGSRSPHAVDLMNQAMVTARRSMLGAMTKGTLFPGWRPDPEVIDQAKVEATVMAAMASNSGGEVSWRELRARVSCDTPALYLESEINTAIKACLRRRAIVSKEADGMAIRENARLRLPATSRDNL